MPKKSIRLTPQADTRTVLAAVRRTVEQHGYHWEPVDRASAEAHEGHRQVRSKLFTLRLAMGAEVRGSKLVLRSLSSGLGLVGATESPAAMVIVGKKFKKLAKAVRDELRSKGLAT